MPHWLLKTEPEDYSWDRLVADGETEWTGVRNHQAMANMKKMALGEHAFFYRSVVEPAILGIMSISATAYPDPEAPWHRVKVRPVRPLPTLVPLKAIKADPRFADLALVRQSRLSVMPVSDAHWAALCAMGGLGP